MKFGASSFIWVSPFSNDTLHLFEKVKKMGFDVLEICIEQVEVVDPYLVKDAADKAGVGVLICGAFGPNRDISSEDSAISENGMAYVKQCIDFANITNSPLVSGPMYAATGLARLLPSDERKKQWQRAAENMKRLADYAGTKGVKLAVEPINRFETDFINTVDQGLEFLEMIGYDNVGLLLDTFHMNIEEKSIGDAIRRAGNKLLNFHACSNDRGTPGQDHLPWGDIFKGLKDANYEGYMVIESFTTAITEIARAVSLWRPLAESQDLLAEEGLDFLRKTFG